MDIRHRTVSDPRTLRALAHPLRMSIMETLGAEGPATATEVAARVGDTPSNCSWHLRTLADAGLIEPAGEGRGRSRPWRLVADSWSVPDQTPEQDAVHDLSFERAVQRLRRGLVAARRLTPPWRGRTMENGLLIWLTPEEFAALRDDLYETAARHWQPVIERNARPETRPAGARLCQISVLGAPVETLGTAAADA